MAYFYGQVSGNSSTNATRTGTKNYGISSSVQSYKGSVTVEMHDNHGENLVTVYISDKSEMYGRIAFTGSIDTLYNKLTN